MRGEIQALFYGFDAARFIKEMLAELLFGNVGCSINTYVRNDNSDAVYHMGSMNTVTNEKRLNGFLESNMEELLLNPWLGVGYIPGGLDTFDGLAKSMSSESKKFACGKYFPNCDRINENQIREKTTWIKTLHRVSGDDTGAENAESRDEEEEEAERLVSISRVFLKAKKLLIKRLRAIKPFSLRGILKGLGGLHMSNFGFFLKSDLAAAISVWGKVLLSQKRLVTAADRVVAGCRCSVMIRKK